ncbi:hypothetical protein A5844_001894 [Enterococcus sp. 10A9_DIV0425]|uniref:Wadjet protein JetD C-terminal domain-containing protein n=1 Tax=Candidatus Enterococcus wittei TaxID=1987383 RepID=A0A242JY03_9ENTE|nr:Wadjet anti-phage system protein JetD domain-containing protein [Enterococcus sp. 10A9_DIV0425]OTP10196.1 hypothetical protein A5844_001894 [Enterococcus sp. 10A9_DIV0425]THE14635.1 hypothetical protein E1H99_04095 [Enterococcus hirae]
MKKIAKKVLVEALIDKYEKSVLSRKGSNRELQIALSIKKYDGTYFDTVNFYQRFEEYNALFAQLVSEEWIRLKTEEQYTTQIFLNLDKLVEIYRYLGKEEPNKKRKELLSFCWQYQEQHPIIKPYCLFIDQQLKTKYSIKKYVPTESVKELKELFDTLVALYNQEEEISIRRFSQQIFSDTKKFSSMQNRIIQFIQQVDDSVPLLESKELLEYFNIAKNPSFIYLKGNVTFSVGQSIIALREDDGAIGLSPEMVPKIELKELLSKQVITIENLTSFHDFIPNNQLVLYLGGFHNRIRREFLKLIYRQFPTKHYLHFGDIDVGGFEIFFHLKEMTGIPFQTLAMDKDTLLKYQSYGKKLSTNDHRRLKILYQKQPLEVFEIMLEKNIKLEQEIISLH